VAGVDDGTASSGPVAEYRLGDILARNADFLSLLHIGDGTLADRLRYRLLNMLAVASQKALPVYSTLVAPVQAPIDQMGHNPTPLARPTAPLLGFTHPQIPFRQQSNLLLGIAALNHTGDEVVVLLLVIGGRFGVEGDDRQQLFRIGEHFFLD